MHYSCLLKISKQPKMNATQNTVTINMEIRNQTKHKMKEYILETLFSLWVINYRNVFTQPSNLLRALRFLTWRRTLFTANRRAMKRRHQNVAARRSSLTSASTSRRWRRRKKTSTTFQVSMLILRVNPSDPGSIRNHYF